MTRALLIPAALLVVGGSAGAHPMLLDERSSMMDEWAYCEAHPCVPIYEARRHLFADASKTITKLVWECDPSDGEPVVGEAAHAGSLEVDAPTNEQMSQRYVCVAGGEGLPVLYGDLAKSLAEPKP